MGEELKRRSSAVINEYTWLISLCDDLRIIEAEEHSSNLNKAHLSSYPMNFKVCDGSITERMENKIEFLDKGILIYYKSVRQFLDFLYEFDGLDYRIIYEFLTTSDSPSTIGKRLKTTTDYVKQVLTDVNNDLYEALNYLDHNIDSKENKEFNVKYTTLYPPEFMEYMQRRIKKIQKKLKR